MSYMYATQTRREVIRRYVDILLSSAFRERERERERENPYKVHVCYNGAATLLPPTR